MISSLKCLADYNIYRTGSYSERLTKLKITLELTTEPGVGDDMLAPLKGLREANLEPAAKADTPWDTNRDDILMLDEYKMGLKGQDNLEARFKSFDKDGDNKLTREEITGSPAR